MRYLGDLYRRFGDWRLAIKAFNEGERAVDRTIAELGTRDPWRLDRYRSPENYLSGAIAMMIVLKNPQILD
jgi:soluble lytic murein transglycosylase-like protein